MYEHFTINTYTEELNLFHKLFVKQAENQLSFFEVFFWLFLESAISRNGPPLYTHGLSVLHRSNTEQDIKTFRAPYIYPLYIGKCLYSM